jgi:hypothetical protein
MVAMILFLSSLFTAAKWVRAALLSTSMVSSVCFPRSQVNVVSFVVFFVALFIVLFFGSTTANTIYRHARPMVHACAALTRVLCSRTARPCPISSVSCKAATLLITYSSRSTTPHLLRQYRFWLQPWSHYSKLWADFLNGTGTKQRFCHLDSSLLFICFCPALKTIGKGSNATVVELSYNWSSMTETTIAGCDDMPV